MDGADAADASIHACAVARAEQGVLLLGPSGAGKSDLAHRLIARGFSLVADDRVILEHGNARPVAPLAGLIEIRGLGLVRMAHRAPVRIVLTVDLTGAPARLPAPVNRAAPLAGPRIAVDPRAASAADTVILALDCLRDDALPVLEIGAFDAPAHRRHGISPAPTPQPAIAGR